MSKIASPVVISDPLSISLYINVNIFSVTFTFSKSYGIAGDSSHFSFTVSALLLDHDVPPSAHFTLLYPVLFASNYVKRHQKEKEVDLPEPFN